MMVGNKMNKKEIMKLLKEKGRTWKEFNEFMYGQTVSMEENGEINYYECDVENFFRQPHSRFFD